MSSIADATGFAKISSVSPYLVDAIFKEWYLPGVRDQLNNKRIISRFFSLHTEGMSIDGKEAVISLGVGRNEASISIEEGGRLPKPGRQRYLNATYRMRYHYSRIKVTGPAMGSSRTNRGSFIRVLDAEMQGSVRDRGIEDNRICFGNGSGVRALAASAGGSATISVANPGGFTNPGPGTQYLRPGMLLGFVDAGTGLLITDGAGTQAWEVLSVNASLGTVTFTTAVPAAIGAGDAIVRVAWEDVAVTDLDSTSWKNEAFGLAAIVDSANPGDGIGGTKLLGGIDATGATSPGTTLWQAAEVNNGGTPIPYTMGMLDLAMDVLDINGDSTVGVWVTTHDIRRQHLHELVAAKRYVNVMETGDGTFRAIEHNGVPIIVDRDMTHGRVYGLNPSSLKKFDETDYFWLDNDGSVLVRDPDRDAYSATLASYSEMGTDKRNANVVIKDIAE